MTPYLGKTPPHIPLTGEKKTIITFIFIQRYTHFYIFSIQPENEMNHVNVWKPPSKQHSKDPCFSLRHFNWLWTNYIIPSQVATADGLVQWSVSIWGQGGLLLGMDTSLLGSLPAWVPPCLLLLLGANRANKVARFQAGDRDAIRQRRHCNASTVTRGLGKHTNMHILTTVQLMEHHTWDNVWGKIDDNGWLDWRTGWHLYSYCGWP